MTNVVGPFLTYATNDFTLLHVYWSTDPPIKEEQNEYLRLFAYKYRGRQATS